MGGSKKLAAAAVPSKAAKVLGIPPPSPLSMMFKYGSAPTPTSFPTLPTYVYYVRFVLAVLYGLYLGTLGTHGATPMFVGMGLIFTVPNTYMEKFLKIDNQLWYDSEVREKVREKSEAK